MNSVKLFLTKSKKTRILMAMKHVEDMSSYKVLL